MREKVDRIISIILLIIWCLIIFYFSNQAGIDSTNSSGQIIDFINKLFSIDLYKYEYSIFIIRKLAHMFLYFVLFILTYNTFNRFKLKKVYLYSFIFCFLYAISDELHQLFIIERTFKISDIFIDMFGSSIALLIIKYIFNKK